MKTLTLLPAGCLGLLLGTLPVGATAQVSPTGNNIGVHLGYAKAKDADGNVLLGGHIEFVPVAFLGLRGSVDYRTVESFDYDYGAEEGEVNLRSIPVMAEARVYVPSGSVSPYAAVGAGWHFLKYDFSDNLEGLGFEDDWDNKFAWHLGAGIVGGVSPAVAVFGEAKAVFLDANRHIDDETLDAVVNFDYDSTYFAAGLNFKF